MFKGLLDKARLDQAIFDQAILDCFMQLSEMSMKEILVGLNLLELT